MILAHHAIFATYGFWLPNDQRGSWSTEVWAQHLQMFGPATKTTARHSLARKPFDQNLRKRSRESLIYPAVQFDEEQRETIGRGFAEIIPKIGLHVRACAIMPDHVHAVVLNHRASVEEIVGYLKRAGTRALTATGLHPLQKYQTNRGRIPTPWVAHGWNRFLNSDVAIVDAMKYVKQNPVRIGLPEQHWDFVEPYNR